MDLFYLHGFSTTPEIWHHQPAGEAPSVRFHDMAAESCRLAVLLKPQTILVGWSMGGMLALQVAAQAPEKLRALVLVSTTPKFIRSDDFPAGLPLVLLKRLEKRIGREGTTAFHDLVFKNGEKIGLAHLPLAEVKHELIELETIDLRALLPKIEVPTLIVHGGRDEICLPSAAEFMRSQIQASELVMLEGVGHAPMIEVPALFNQHFNKFVDKYAG